MYISLKYSGYNRNGEQSSAGHFLILLQPKFDSGTFPEFETNCSNCGKPKSEHKSDANVIIPTCDVHGIVARIRRAKDANSISDAEILAMDVPVPSCPQCTLRKQFLAELGCCNFRPSRIDYPLRAIVRYVRMTQCGNFMMGTARIGKHKIVLSGSYGSDGLPCTVPDEIYQMGLEVPSELRELWNNGGGWNSAGSEASEMRKWAIANFPKKQ